MTTAHFKPSSYRILGRIALRSSDAAALGFSLALALALGLALVATPISSHANTVRLANQGDVLSLDPHSFNEAVQLSFLNNVFEPLVTRGKDLKIAPALATKWTATSPTVWRFELRQGAKFHDGSVFTADDAVFSLERARGEGSDLRPQLASVRAVRKVSDSVVELDTSAPNPILPELMTSVLMMSKAWCETNQATQPVDRRKGIENAASFRANGTGPYRVRERQPGTRTVVVRHTAWWGTDVGNVEQVVFLPIENNATRVAALLSGEVDVIDPVPLPDMARVAATPQLRVIETPELRVIFLGFDHRREELPGSNIKGRNPFKDVRVRRAVYQAIDIQTIQTRIMRGSSVPTGGMVAEGVQGYTADMRTRLPFDPDAARKLLAEAGLPNGFDVSMNCPNDRYVNDGEICQAVAANLARVGIKVNLQLEGKTTYFPKGLRRDFGFFMLGWTPAGIDAHNLLFTVLGTPAANRGSWNFGGYSNARLDELTTKIQSEINPAARSQMVKEAFELHAQDIGHVPLHQQTLQAAAKSHVTVHQRADGFMLFKWMSVGKPPAPAVRP